ncbi:MAG: hypothetical protein K2P90_02735 [Holosporales bacterium]|jgi:hypothetical protein|nr:hypothetical protein [Holosporales bacterium]
MTSDTLRLKFVADLEKLFEMALEKENFTIALKAKELLGRERGYFRLPEKSPSLFPLDLQALNDDQLSTLLSRLKEYAPQDSSIDKL